MERIWATLHDLLTLNSPSQRERPVADYVARRLRQLGLEVHEDEAGQRWQGNAGNVIGVTDGWSLPPGKEERDSPRLLLCAHMDTVQPTEGIQVLRQGDRVRAQNSPILGADDKAGITAILEALAWLRASQRPCPPLAVAFTIAEEVGLWGAQALDTAALRCQMGFVLDSGSPPGTFVVQAPAEDDLRIRVQGRSAHAGVEPEKGINAIAAAAKAIGALPWGRLDSETTANVGIIHGGTAVNIVPDRVEIRAEARSLDEGKLQTHVKKMQQVFQEEVQRNGARVEIQVSRLYPAFRLTEQDRPVQLAKKAAAAVGLEAQLQSRGGGSDANIFNGRGVPTVNVGLGVQGEHTQEETLSLQDLQASTALVVAILQAALE
ncbi:MAG: M20/M25/M40 family metallo-hydrolase [Firmicutes bacterium]|nr:M20/M25/M40 family metallo-hydrolase [Bacillota bacterium]